MKKTDNNDFELFPWWLIVTFIILTVGVGIWTYISLKA